MHSNLLISILFSLFVDTEEIAHGEDIEEIPPFYVMLNTPVNQFSSIICGGTFINSNFVITHSMCVGQCMSDFV